MAQNAFGLADNPDEDPFAEPDEEKEQVTEPAEEEEAPAAPEPAPEEEVEEAPTEPEAEATPEAEETPSDLLLGKFKSVEELEKAYQNVESLSSRVTARQREMEQRMAQLQSYADQAYAQLEAQKRQETLEPDEAILDAAREAGLDENVMKIVQTLADRQAATRVNELQRQMQATQMSQQQQSAISARQAVIDDFFTRHPDVTPESPEDNSIAQFMVKYDMNADNPDSFEIAYEAVMDPALRKVLAKSPILMDDDEGMEIAREEANLQRSLLAAAKAQGTGDKKGAAAKAAQVTTGGGGAPPGPGENTEDDDWAAAIALGGVEPPSAFGI